MPRSRSVLGTVTVGALVAISGLLALPATAAPTPAGAAAPLSASCTNSWKSAISGLWSVAANWTNGVPVGGDDVCITVPGTYTVTLAPWTIGTADPNHNGADVRSLTLGAATGPGTQTLDIAGQGSTSNSNEQVSTVSLTLAGASTITAHGRLLLDSTDGGSRLPGNPTGGFAAVSGATIRNFGSVETRAQDPHNKYADFTQIAAPLTNEARADVLDSSGTLQVGDVTNDGSFTVAPGASLALVPLQGGYGAPESFTNNGQFLNDGTVAAAQGTATWVQAGGPVRGHEVVLQGGATLVDKRGAGRFLVNAVGAKLTGTIPSGQEVTVVGEAYNSNGNAYNGTTLALGGTTVVNDGTLVLDAQGPTKANGGPAVVSDGSVRNNGTIVAEVQGPAWTVEYQAGLTNNRGGSLTVKGGMFTDDAAAPVTNEGTVTIGPGSMYLLEEGATFANESGGRIVTEIANAKSLGQFQLASPCCAGAGKFIAGGALLPELAGGYSPAAGTEFQPWLLSGGTFSGVFAHLGVGFSADYAHESASPAFVGVIYHKQPRGRNAGARSGRSARPAHG